MQHFNNAEDATAALKEVGRALRSKLLVHQNA